MGVRLPLPPLLSMLLDTAAAATAAAATAAAAKNKSPLVFLGTCLKRDQSGTQLPNRRQARRDAHSRALPYPWLSAEWSRVLPSGCQPKGGQGCQPFGVSFLRRGHCDRTSNDIAALVFRSCRPSRPWHALCGRARETWPWDAGHIRCTSGRCWRQPDPLVLVAFGPARAGREHATPERATL